MNCVFIHGLGQTPESWDAVASRLPAGPEIHRSALDAAAAEGPLTYGRLYGAFAGECGRLEGPLRLCGISLGAVLAMQYALEEPARVDSLVLIAPQYRMPRLLLKFQNAVFRLLPRAAFRGMGFERRDVISLTQSMGELDFTARLGELKCPALIVCGGRDRANRRAAEEMARALPRAGLSIVEGAGHEVNVDAPGELSALIREAWSLG